MYPRFAFTLLFSFAAIGLGIAIPAFPSDERCGLNALYNECGSACAPTCANPNPGPICTLQCVIGCFCREGYLKNAQGQCVRPIECDGQAHRLPFQIPSVPSAAAAFPTCPDNEVFQACGSACAPTCANPHPGPACTKNCVVGCFCKDGHLRNARGVCVPASNCDAAAPQPLVAEAQQCKENEIYKTCGSACPPTCSQPDRRPCSLRCFHGCFCKDGYLRNAEGVCVPASQCDAVAPQLLVAEVQQCKVNEIYKTCGTACPPTCGQPDRRPCSLRCIPGCFCQDGHLRNAEGVCVPASQCDAAAPQLLLAEVQQCKANEVFTTCGSACPPTCNAPQGLPCSLRCIPGCFCKPGYLRNNQGVCVPKTQCETPACGENEEYRQCKGCDGTCDKPNPLCPRICLAGCACKQGHLRDGANGKCIPKEQCQAALPQPLVAMQLNTETKCLSDREMFVEECGNQLDCLATCHAAPAFLVHGYPQVPKKCLVRMCKPSCVCKHPYVRNEQGQCVERNQCDQLTTTPQVPVTTH